MFPFLSVTVMVHPRLLTPVTVNCATKIELRSGFSVLVVLVGLTVAQAGFEELAVSTPLYCTVAVKVLDTPGVRSRRVDGLTLSRAEPLASSGAVDVDVGSELQAPRVTAAVSTPAASGHERIRGMGISGRGLQAELGNLSNGRIAHRGPAGSTDPGRAESLARLAPDRSHVRSAADEPAVPEAGGGRSTRGLRSHG
jgi:hypothetical protein